MSALPNNEIPDVRQDTIKRDSAFMVFDGSHKLSPKEHKFISCYMVHFDEGKAAEEAGYSVRPTVQNKKAYFKGDTFILNKFIKQKVKIILLKIRKD